MSLCFQNMSEKLLWQYSKSGRALMLCTCTMQGHRQTNKHTHTTKMNIRCKSLLSDNVAQAQVLCSDQVVMTIKDNGIHGNHNNSIMMHY